GDPSGDFFSPSALKGRASGRSCPPTGPPLGKTLIGLRPRSRAQAGGTCVDRESRRGCPHLNLNGDSLLASAGKRRASGRSCPPTGPPLGKTLIGLRPRSRAQAGGTCVDRGSRRGCPHLNLSGYSLLASAGKRRASGLFFPPSGFPGEQPCFPTPRTPGLAGGTCVDRESRRGCRHLNG